VRALDHGGGRAGQRPPRDAPLRASSDMRTRVPREGALSELERRIAACYFWVGAMAMASMSESGSFEALMGVPALPLATVIGVTVPLPLPTT
jgi:hypothetical protein